MFLDGDTWLCPARFDGHHNSLRELETQQKQTELSTARRTSGTLGGNARAQNLTPLQRRRIAQQAARARWSQNRR